MKTPAVLATTLASALTISLIGVPANAAPLGGVSITVSDNPATAGSPVIITSEIANPELTQQGGNFTTSVGPVVADSTDTGPGTSQLAVSYAPQTAGAVNINVTYTAADGAVNSGQTTLTVAKAPSVVTVSTPSHVIPGQTITVNTDVTSDLDAAPTGTVTLTVNGTDLTTAPVGTFGQTDLTATLPTDLNLGRAAVTVRYSGDANNEPALGRDIMTVDTVTQMSLTAPGQIAAGQTTQLTANVWPPEATGTVTFFAQDAPLDAPQPVVNGQARLLWTPPSAGGYTITANYSGDSANPAASVRDRVRVTPSAGIDTITALLNGAPIGATGSAVVYGADYTLTFTDSSGAPVTGVNAQGPCTLTGTTLAVTSGTGECIISASSPGAGNLAGTTSTWTLTASKAAQQPVRTMRARKPRAGKTVTIARAGAEETTIGQRITYKVTRGKNKCSVKVTKKGAVKLKARKKGTCVVTAKASGIDNLYLPYTQRQKYKVRKKK